jgi:hypothetical protein
MSVNEKQAGHCWPAVEEEHFWFYSNDSNFSGNGDLSSFNKIQLPIGWQ